jgi:hypothetical protein
MKNLKYIIVPALAAFMFTACNNEVKGPTQAEIDTQVEVKVKAATDQLKADCDSRILQAAQLKADSMMAKTVSQQAETTTAPVAAPKPVAPTPKPTTKPTTKPEVKTNPKADRFNNNGGKNVTKEDTKEKADRFENEGKKEVTAEDTKKKADRFKK